MDIRNSYKYIFSIIFFITSQIYSQNDFNTISVTDTILINLKNEYKIKAISIIPFSEKLIISGRNLNNNDYNFDYRLGKFTLSDSLEYSIFDTVFISYEMRLINIKKEYKNRSLVYQYDELNSDTVRIVKSLSKPLTSESIFGEGIQKSGTILRGFTVGTNKDFTVNSGLRLQLSGRLSDDIEIVAALTDENTPIQPEGNTETLDELDKVFIELKHKNAIGTFGDYDLTKRIGEFGNINRKLQGIKAEFNLDNYSGAVAIAGSRGKFNTNEFTGQDGNQGPYRLYGVNNERNIIIIAGSEKIYLDGVELKRGENNDYTIEYANSEIIFTPNRIITSASRINVDFEYTDRQFNRNYIGADLSSSFFNNKLKITLGFFKEGDDKNSPIDISISDNERKILELAGDDRNKAIIDGAKIAEPDSLGNIKGFYEKIDSTINGIMYSIYKYNPGGINSLYNVTFSFVGAGKGDYSQISLGNYRFAGPGEGSYMPIKYLPVAQSNQQANIIIEAEPFKDVNLKLEFAGSIFDKNTFSNINDGDNFGNARNIFLNIKPREIYLGGISLGKAGLSYKDRFIQNKFSALDRINEAEFKRYYNVSDNINADEQLREINLSIVPTENLKINSQYGFLKKGNSFNSDRFFTNVDFRKDESINVYYNFDIVKSENSLIKSNWLRQNGKADYNFGFIKPGFEFLHEDKKENLLSSDSLINTSLYYFEYSPLFEISGGSGVTFTAKYSIRDESFPLAGVLNSESRSTLQSYQINYSGIKEFTTNLNVTFRNKKYEEIFKELGRIDNETVLIRSQSRISLFKRFLEGESFYEASTQKAARLEKVFIRVEQGTGNYIYLGDINNNGIAEEFEFEPAVYDGDFIVTTIPTDELFPVIDLKANVHFNLDFSKIFSGNGLLNALLNPLSTETFLRVEENSKEPDLNKIYLLQFSNFLNDSTTITGFNSIQQDLNLFKNKREFSLRFRFNQRQSLNQYSAGTEKGFARERSLRLKFKMVKEINNQTDLVNEIDNLYANSSSNRARLLTRNEISTDFSYRPENNIEIGFKIKSGRSQDDYPSSPTIITNNSLTLSITYSIANRGRLRAEIERNELLTNTNENFIPFEILRGNLIGKNYFWRLNFDYRISGNLQTTVTYNGRLQGKGKTVHTMRTEARAYF